jgi:hypothetical protein
MHNETDQILQHDERDPEDSFDRVLRSELSWQASPDLTASLLALVPAEAQMLAHPDQPPAPARPRTWYTTLVTILTMLAVSLSLAVAWQYMLLVGAELGLASIISQVQALPATLLGWLYAELPAARALVEFLGAAQAYLHWLLVAIVLWLAVDARAPGATLQQQTSS